MPFDHIEDTNWSICGGRGCCKGQERLDAASSDRAADQIVHLLLAASAVTAAAAACQSTDSFNLQRQWQQWLLLLRCPVPTCHPSCTQNFQPLLQVSLHTMCQFETRQQYVSLTARTAALDVIATALQLLTRTATLRTPL
jgi:hypothetical protein